MDANVENEHRKRQDRRIDDQGPPPGIEEKRMMPERRHPDVEHIDFVEQIELVGISEEGPKHPPSPNFPA